MSNFGIKNIWKETNTGGSVDTSNLVTLDGNQTITGTKTFNALPQSSVAPTNANDLVTKNYTDTNFVKLTDAQTINGVKTFTNLPQSSAIPSNNNDLTNKSYVDSKVGQWYKLGYVASGHIEPNQNTTPQVINFTNYDLRHGMFSFIVKTGISGHDFSFGFYGVAITDTSPYSVLTNSLYISNQDNTKGFYLKIERTTNQQIKLWFHDLNNTGFTVSYWGVFVKREGDLISLT